MQRWGYKLHWWTQLLTWKGRFRRCGKMGEYIGIIYHIILGDNDSGNYEINYPYYGGGSSEEWLVWKFKLLMALDGQSIGAIPQRYTFTERLLIGDAKATFNQAALVIGIHTIDNFNKVLLEITKHAFPAYTFRKQIRYLRRHLIKPRSMKLCSIISRLQELNAYLEEFPPDR